MGGAAAPLTLSRGREPGNGPAEREGVLGVCVSALTRLAGWLASRYARWMRALALANRLNHV